MVAIISVGGAINGYSTSYADQAARDTAPGTEQTLSGFDVMELCRVEMLNLGIHRYTVPTFIPDRHGNNVQAEQPWRVGATVKVLPDRRVAGTQEPEPYADTVACTIPAE